MLSVELAKRRYHGKEFEEGQETGKDPASEEKVAGRLLERRTAMAKKLKKAKKLVATKPLRGRR